MIMQQMRQNTKWIMLVTALAFVGLMVFGWGMDLSGRSSQRFTGGDVGQVNGEPVTYNQFETVYRNLYQQTQQQSNQPISTAQDKKLQDQAWQQIVSDRLIEQELQRRGIHVTDAEIRQAARYAPPPEFYNAPQFQTNGKFDINKYQQFLASSGPDVLSQLESYYRSILPRNKLFEQVAAGAYVTDDQLWRLYVEQHETASVRYIAMVPDAMVSDGDVNITDAEIQTYYQNHKGDFGRPAQATVKVAGVDRQPTAADTAAARQHALDVRKEILGGTDFADVAAQESADKATADKGGNLGTLTRGQTVPAFDQAIWNTPVGRLSEPILTQYGYHILQVQSRSGDSAQVRHILIPIERTSASEDSLMTEVDSLEVLIGKLPLEDAAKDLGLRVRETKLTPQLPMVAGIGNIQNGADWVFNDASVAGDVSPILESPSYYYAVEIVTKTPARTLSLDEATPTIRTVLLRQKKRDRARQIALSLLDGVKPGTSLDSIARLAKLQVRDAGPFTRFDYVPGLGSGNAAVGTAFGLPIGKVSGLVETPNGFFVMEVTKRTMPDRKDFDAQKAQERSQVIAGLQRQRINNFLQALHDNAQIVDNREKVMQASGTETS
jgi:peptidyl-prolyl cis-trans isomerase D